MKALLLLLSAVTVRGAPEFVGYWAIGNEIAFAVMDSASEGPPKWVRMGSDFSGFRLVEYRAGADILVFRKGSTNLELKLRSAKVRQGNAEVSAADAYAVAIREVQRREVWASRGRFEAPQRGKKNWLIPVFRRLDDGSEECVLIGVGIADGTVAEYRYINSGGKMPNKAPEPTPGAVTPRATEGVLR